MKANDLMIGDKVKTPIGIATVEMIMIGLICVSYRGSLILYPINIVEPVLLTDEILGKNRCLDSLPFWIANYPDDHKLCGKYGILPKEEESEFALFTIQYVHELQHLVKLNGIETEIVL